MAWSDQFRNALGFTSISVEYKLEFLRIGNSVGRAITVRSSGNDILKIANGSVQVSGTRVIPQRWGVSFGQFSVSVVGDIRMITDRVRKGQLAQISCKFPTQTGYERLAIGALTNISGSRNNFLLEFNDLLTALSNSLDARAGVAFSSTNPPHFQLFYKAGLTDTVRTAFTVGDTTLAVNSNAIFETKTGSRGLIKCTASASGNSFFLFFTGKGTNTLTGISSSVYPSGSPENLQVGDTVTALVWLEGSPFDIFGSIITSTGNGTNGILDDYPEAWSIGGGVSNSLWDYSDSSKQVRVIQRSDGGLYEWGFYVDTPPSNGVRYLTDLATTLGQWPVFRMGLLSWRACTDPTGVQTGIEIVVAAEIGDSDIFSIVRHDFYNRDVPTIYRTSRVIYNQSGSGHYSGQIYDNNQVRSLPAQKRIERNGVSLYLSDQSGSDNRNQAGLMDLKRMQAWDLFESEKLVLRVNLKFAYLVAGDIVELTSQYLSGAYDPVGYTFRRRRLMVFACDFNIDEQNCTLTLGMISRRLFND